MDDGGGDADGAIGVSDHGPVRLLTIDRPRRRNALTPGLVARLCQQVEAAGRDPAVGAIVLAGAGGHFCAGGDAQAITEVIGAGSQQAAIAFMRHFQALVEALWTSDLPVVAAVSGIAYGGGFNLALACDLIITSADARFCQVFLRRGLIPDLGGAYLLPRLVGVQRAKELMLRTREIGAAEAREMGLVSSVTADPDAALAEALSAGAELAARPRLAVTLTKHLINSGTDGSLQSSLEQEALSQAAALSTQEAADGFAAFTRQRRD
ncbi:MAG: enoyl-CoA hydratase/isomerase family protein [Streptosporangiaceae bacterium]